MILYQQTGRVMLLHVRTSGLMIILGWLGNAQEEAIGRIMTIAIMKQRNTKQ